nr:hypothetical protein [Tanacetum cinerariifolium]
MSQNERQKEKVAENASNKRKCKGNHNGSSGQQNKGHKVPRAHTAWPINKKAYVGSLPLCNQCKFHHNGPCTIKCRNFKKVGHIIQNCRTPATAKNKQTRTCYECGSLRHYKSECPIVKFHKPMDMIHGRTENKKRLDNTSKNNQNQQQQQPNKRQNTGRVYIAASGKRKEYAGTLPLCNKCKFHHNGQCTIKYVNCKRVGHLTQDCRSPAATNNHRNPTCYGSGNQGHYRSNCPELKKQDHGNQAGGTGAHGMVHALGGGETNQDINNVKDDINA